jgi:hypothetical protein
MTSVSVHTYSYVLDLQLRTSAAVTSATRSFSRAMRILESLRKTTCRAGQHSGHTLIIRSALISESANPEHPAVPGLALLVMSAILIAQISR